MNKMRVSMQAPSRYKGQIVTTLRSYPHPWDSRGDTCYDCQLEDGTRCYYEKWELEPLQEETNGRD